MQAVLPPAVAGLFYPQDRAQLHSHVASLLDGGSPLPLCPKALLVPHAGYQYSAVVAACGYRSLKACAQRIRRVVLLGPSHRHPLRGLALPQADSLSTPLGRIAIDTAACEQLQTLGVTRNDLAHASEHALEVQLPFLQTLLAEFTLVPLVVGASNPQQVATIIDALWGGSETLIIVSSDLSHYESHASARERDLATLAGISAGELALNHQQACGATPLAGLLLCARQRGLHAQLLDYRNSGDTAGPKDRVVGYAAMAFSSEEDGHAHTH